MSWLSGWDYRRSHVINSALNAGTNYQVKIKCYYSQIPTSEEDYTRYGSNPFSLSGDSSGYGAVHPMILYFPDGMDGYKYWIYYEKGITQTNCDVYLERSNDGLTWTDIGVSNPIITSHPIANTHIPDPDVIKVGDTWYMYLSGDSSGLNGLTDSIYLYTSNDGKSWSSYSNIAVLTKSGVGHESTGIACATLYYDVDESKFYMWYSGYDGATWRLCLADSDDGIIWDKSASNPMLDDAVHVAVAKYGDTYYLAFIRGSPIEVYMATSSDKVTWTENANNPILTHLGAGWESSYLYRSAWLRNQYGIGVTIDNNKMLYYSAFGGTYYNIGLAYVIPSANTVSLENHSRTDFGDVRFTDVGGVTLLDYWIEKKIDEDYVIFWVKVTDDLSSESATVYVYYGKPNATTTSDGVDTFLFFDDFSEGSVNWAKWQSNLQSAYTIVDGELRAGSIDTTSDLICSISNFNGFVTQCKARCPLTDDQAYFLSETTAKAYTGKDFNVIGRNSGMLYSFLNGESSGLAEESSSIYTLILKVPSSGNAIALIYLGNTLKVSKTAVPAYRTGYVSMFSWLEKVVYFDDVFVRNYVDPEPAHGSWGSEEEVALPASKIFVIDKENNLFKINPSDLSEEKTLDVS